MAKYFGTDGVRGVANTELTADLALRLGMAAATVLQDLPSKTVCIGKDSRLSGDMLECALAAGFAACGWQVLCLGVLPTPAVSFLTQKLGAGVGAMISASHNPAEFNGIKLFGADGRKLGDNLEEAIEQGLDGLLPFTPAPAHAIGSVRHAPHLATEYIAHVQSFLPDLTGMKVLLDCANGASSATAEQIFGQSGAQITCVHNVPDGCNINENCGSTHAQLLSRQVREGGFDAAFAFDGDADRCLCLDGEGELLDGDRILAMLAADYQSRNRLPENTVVATCMSNLGLFESLKKLNIRVLEAQVGDRFVSEMMQAGGYVLGGEQSGHLILGDRAVTGDGQLTAAALLSLIRRSGKSLSELKQIMTVFPQVLRNVNVPNAVKKLIPAHPKVEALQKELCATEGIGRILLRPSGTEPKLRILIEGADQTLLEQAATTLEQAVLEAASLLA